MADNFTLIHPITLDGHWLADHKREVSSSVPVVNGTAHLYIHSQYEALSYLSAPSPAHFPEVSCSANSPALHLINQLLFPLQSHYSSFFPSFLRLSDSSVSSASFLVLNTAHPKTGSHVTGAGSMECIFCHALYNETYITCLQLFIAAGHSGCF